MRQYLDMLRDIQTNGILKDDRTGTGTRSLFGMQVRYSLKGKLPVVTTKRVHLHSVLHELLWMLSGDTNIKYLKDNNVRIWNEWADDAGDLGPVYGKQWRDFGGVDQIQNVIESIRQDPEGRRHLVSAWNPTELEQMALPPCHTLFQFYLRKLTEEESTLASTLQDNNEVPAPEYGISCQLYQRSADAFLGVPFNITFYSLLTYLVGQQVNAFPLEFIWTGGDCHIYNNHTEQVALQLTRDPYPLPTLKVTPKPTIFDYRAEDIQVNNYVHHPAILGKVSV